MPLLRYLVARRLRVLYTRLGYNSGVLKISLDKFYIFASVFWWVGNNLLALEHEGVCGAFVGADAAADADFSIYDGYFTRFVLEFFHLAVVIFYHGDSILGFG